MTTAKRSASTPKAKKTAQPKAKPKYGRIGSEKPEEELPAFVTMERDARSSGEAEDPRRTDRVAGLTGREIALRLLAPKRPQRDAVLDALDGITEPAEAWEVLAARDLIPVEWTSGGSRQVTVDGVSCKRCGAKVEFIGHLRDCPDANTPATVRAAATLAADPAGISAAESLAKLAFERLYGDVALADPRVVWRVGEHSKCGPLSDRRPGQVRAKSAKPGLWEAWSTYVKQFRGERDDLTLPPQYRRYDEGRFVHEAQGGRWLDGVARSLVEIVLEPWVRALQRDAVFHWGWALSVRETRPNPFTPVCEVWALGYAVDIVDDELIVLFAPALNA